MKAEKLIYSLSVILTKIINFNKEFERVKVKNILIIKLDEAGDMIYATPVFKLIKEQYPNANITLWCKDYISELIKYDPYLNTIINHKNKLERKYDLILDLRGNFDSLIYATMHPPKLRLDRGTVRLRNKIKGKQPHEIQTNFEVINALIPKAPAELFPKIYYSKEDEKFVMEYLQENEIQKFTILHVGANKELRKWPLERYAALANILKNQYKLDLIFVGSQLDIIDIKEVQKLLNFKTYSTAGIFNWTKYAAIVQKASLFIGNESGPMHIAVAMKTPLIGLFGPGEPNIFYPLGEKSTFVHHVLDCNPCDQIHCVHLGNTCMHRINLNQVIDKLTALGF
jgi:ADP-heptose:LPS heptosyltransferase